MMTIMTNVIAETMNAILKLPPCRSNT